MSKRRAPGYFQTEPQAWVLRSNKMARPIWYAGYDDGIVETIVCYATNIFDAHYFDSEEGAHDVQAQLGDDWAVSEILGMGASA